MPSTNAPSFFRCPNCNALYQVVRAKAGPETVDLEAACGICNGALVAREGQCARGGVVTTPREEHPKNPLLLFSVCVGLIGPSTVAFNGDVVRELATEALAHRVENA
jgi:predicted Zn finger-like uncharacterized protein